MKFKIITILFVLFTFCFSQNVEELVRGPITGFTETPRLGKFTISTNLVKGSTTSIFDEDGDEVTLNKLEDGDADPEVYSTVLNVFGEYAVNNKTTVFIRIPFYISQGVRFDNVSPDWTSYYEDMSGETGLGDIRFGGSYLINSSDKNRIMVVASYKATTGGDPYDIDEDAFSSTGTDQTDIDFGGALDYAFAPNMLLSIGGSYTLRNEGSYSSGGDSWDEKPGNEINFGGRFSLRLNPSMAIGLDLDYSSAGEDEFDGESIDDTESNWLSFAPTAGYQIVSGSTIVNLNGSYLLHMSGQNIFKFNAFLLGTTIYF